MEKILIVEDELIVARDIRKTLERNGYKVAGVARSAEKALLLIEEDRPAFVLVDIFLKGDLTGIDLATRLNNEGIPFIYVSANSNQPVLEAAKTTHPYGFIVKPFREKDLLVTIDIARYRFENDKRMQLAAVTSPQPETITGNTTSPPPGLGTASEGLIGKSAGMLRVFNLIQQVAPFDTSVLILGESGTGKEGVATAVFRQSNRGAKPFIKINCAAIPADLIEAELFGYERGAFTGAVERRIGKFEQASGGTLLLDEIGELPIDMQAKLLRVLQEKEIQRIGGRSFIKTDVRVIAATARNLEKEVAQGRFRLDLYYRLNVFPVVLPPLRERKDDIPLLLHHFISYYSGRTGKKVNGVTEEVLQQLVHYSWPGNVRELQHFVERSLLLEKGDRIREVSLPEEPSFLPTDSLPVPTGIQQTGNDTEKVQILAVLQACNFKITGKGGAAEILKMPPATLRDKMKRLGIKKSFF